MSSEPKILLTYATMILYMNSCKIYIKALKINSYLDVDELVHVGPVAQVEQERRVVADGHALALDRDGDRLLVAANLVRRGNGDGDVSLVDRCHDGDPDLDGRPRRHDDQVLVLAALRPRFVGLHVAVFFDVDEFVLVRILEAEEDVQLHLTVKIVNTSSRTYSHELRNTLRIQTRTLIEMITSTVHIPLTKPITHQGHFVNKLFR